MASGFGPSKQVRCVAAFSAGSCRRRAVNAKSGRKPQLAGILSLVLDVQIFALAIPAVIFAGVSKGGFGSGAAFAASSILALVFEPGVAIGVMLPLLLVMDVTALKGFWRKWDWALSLPIIVGAIPGVVMGAVLYKATNPDVFRFLIGVISILFVFWQIGNRVGWITRRAKPFSRSGGLLAGVTGGFTSFVSHAGGPPVAVYLLSHPVTKTTYQASTVLIFWIVNLAKLVPYSMVGIFSRETLLADVYLFPFAIFGAWLGIKAHERIPERLFFDLTYALLLFTGSKLIFDSLT